MGYMPTIEELQFVYEMILNGCTDREILEEYARLLSRGQLMFPMRPDKRFVKARRRELQAADAVLQDYVKRRVDPVISQRKEQHFSRLAEIANSLLSGRLKDIQEIVDPADKDGSRPKYAVFTEYDVDVLAEFSPRELIDQLGKNLDLTCEKFGKWDVMGLFIPHLKAENAELESKGILTIIRENPLELIETLRILSSRRTFKGTCPVCQDW